MIRCVKSLVLWFNVKTRELWEGKHDNEEWDLHQEHLFLRARDIREGVTLRSLECI
jgi:hypothetical protein